MDIYYINLARRADRREFMEAQFERLGLAATRIEAVTPDAVSAADLKAWCHPARLRWLTPPELCCGLSHIRALETLLRSSAPHAAIFEDDVKLSPLLPQFLAAFDRAPPALDLLRIETVMRPLRLKPEGLSVAGFAIARFVGCEGGSAGYIVTRHGAEVAVAGGRLKERFTDHALFDSEAPLARQLDIRQANPALCMQMQAVSPEDPILPSDLVLASVRRAGEARYRLRHLLFRRYQAIHRDLVLAARKFWFVQAQGARRLHIPLAE